MSCHQSWLLYPHKFMLPLEQQIIYLKVVRDVYGKVIRDQTIKYYRSLKKKSALGKFTSGNFKNLEPYQVRLLYCCFRSHFNDEETDTLLFNQSLNLSYFDFCYLEDNVIEKLQLCRSHLERIKKRNSGMRHIHNFWIFAFKDRFMFYGYFSIVDLPNRKVSYDLREITDQHPSRRPNFYNRFGGTPESHIRNINKLAKYCRRAGITTFRVETELANALKISELMPIFGFKLEQHRDFEHEVTMWTKQGTELSSNFYS